MGMRATLVAVALMVVMGLYAGQDGEVKTMETYLMETPQKAIDGLMPDTERWFFFKCLEHQKAGELETADDRCIRGIASAGNDAGKL